MSYSYDDVYILHAWRDNRRRLVLTQGEGYSGTITDNDVIKAPRFQLRDERDVIEIPSSGNPNVQLAVTRSNHTEDLLACTVVDRENGIISCPITKSLTDVAGEVKGEIRLVTANSVTKFYGVDFYIFDGVSDAAAAQSSQFSALIEALQQVGLVISGGSEGTVALDTVIQHNGTKPVASGVLYDYLQGNYRQISFAHENNESSYDDGGVYIDDATDIMKMYYVKNLNGARVGILFCVRTPGYNYGTQVKIDAYGNITTRVKTQESGEADYTWKSWSPIGKNANIADDAVTIEKLQSNIRTSISNADACALTLSRNFGINVSAESTNENYHMRTDGGGEPKAGYEIRRYPVSAGQIISIYCSDSEAGCKWVFKSANSGHWNVNVGNVHPNAGRWIVEVPENATYLFTSTFIGDSTSEVAIIPPSTGGYILHPCVFAYLSAQKLHIECTATARAVLGNSILNISGWSDIFTPRTNSTDALVMGINAFSLKHVEDLTDGDCVIALVYLPQKTVVPVDKNIYANAIPIDNLYKRSNIPVYINNRRIKRYQIAPNRNSANITDFGYFYKLNNVSSTQPLMYIAPNGKLVPNLNTYSTNNISIANKTILCIGDSVTKRGWYQERLKSYESTLSFIGAQTTYYGQNGNATDGKYYCEGYSGRTAKNVLVDSTILLNDNVTRITNPFYDSTTGKCDFGYYCRTQNVSPDYVLIEFGLNETNSDEYYTAISSFIATIKAYNENTVVYVIQPFNAIDGGDIGAANSMTAMQREACERCILESRSFTDCVLIPCWYIMVDAYDYPIADVSYGYGNVTIKQASDGVHPSESVGFAKLGDQIYNYLGITS